MDREEFGRWAHELVEWMCWYYDHVEELPVRAQVAPGEVAEKLAEEAPESSEDFESIFNDFKDLVVPGMTHWQHPKFFAYFPANSSYPSVLAEMLTATLAAQCMIWQTSPAATEMEERVLRWIARLIGLPESFDGVIQDTASTSTLVALLTAREVATEFRSNEEGLFGLPGMTVYASEQTHSSIEKAVKIAGFGRKNYRPIAVDENFAMRVDELEKAIEEDKKAGLAPCAVVVTLGTTGSTAIDPLSEACEVAKRHGLWVHVDAALAGSAFVLPELAWMIEGIEDVDSFTFNPHKWLFTNFDCSAYYVKDREALIRTFEIHPEYLKTSEGDRVNNYRDWGVQLGRRFRALKLWFVLRSFGAERIRALLREHILLATELSSWIKADPDFELLAPVPLNTVCFRYRPRDEKFGTLEDVNDVNAELLARVNDSGKAYLTHTVLGGHYTIRFVVGQTRVERRHVEETWALIRETARSLGSVD
jgi:aromatic-L-amino-acid decarboxylase